MTDIVERLRDWSRDLQTGRDCFGADQDLKKAADEIERLRAALQEIETLELDPRNSGQMWVETLKEVARAALGESKCPT